MCHEVIENQKVKETEQKQQNLNKKKITQINNK